jgi:dihydrolipoamide dehydrogenase
MAVDMDGRFVKVDDQCRTSMKNVWAIGDLVGEPMLEHKAMAQGEMVAEIIAGHKRRFDPARSPRSASPSPRSSAPAFCPRRRRRKGVEIDHRDVPVSANGRALSMDATSGGFVRVLARKDDHRILGIQAVGAHVSELSANSPWRWRWARCWKTSPAPSTSTRR